MDTHPVVVVLGVVASIATVLIGSGAVALPGFGGRGGDGEPCPSISDRSGASGTEATVTGTAFRVVVRIAGTSDALLPRQPDLGARTSDRRCSVRTPFELART